MAGFTEVAYFVGLDPFELLRKADISPHFLDDPENRHSARALVSALEAAAAESGREDFGLLMAQCRVLSSLGPLSLLLERLPTVGHVLDALNQYRFLMNDVVSLEWIRGDDVSALCWVFAPGFESTQLSNLTVGLGYRLLTESLGARWQPEIVHFTHAAPRDLKHFQQFFSAPLDFDCTFNGYSCRTSALEAPVPAADPIMADHARRLLELLPAQGGYAPVSDATCRAIFLLLPSGRATLAAVAANLGISGSALERRLATEGKSFKALYNETRRNTAERFLATSCSIETVAELVGAHSAKAFAGWFQEEFGQSPAVWQQERRGVSAQLTNA
ncbi:MAG: AraC family transcriptional regulator ligand-binding domain-containing protein [Sphingomicrobium sp.]